jgi:phage gpG-like protein
MARGIIEVREIRGGSREALRKMRLLTRKVKNPAPANRRVSVWLLRWVNDNFKTQGGKVGKWKPFKLGGRRIPGGGIDRSAKLLQDTGRLRASFNAFHSRTVAGVGSNLNYSITHELGLPHRNLPRRRMLPLASDRSVTAGIVRIYDNYIRAAAR